MVEGGCHGRPCQHRLVAKDPIAPNGNDEILVAHLWGTDHDDRCCCVKQGCVVVPRLCVAIEEAA
jgi:hypothetical protein